MADDPIRHDFDHPPAPGGGWPAVVGSPGEEFSPEDAVTSGSASYELVYAWQVD